MTEPRMIMLRRLIGAGQAPTRDDALYLLGMIDDLADLVSTRKAALDWAAQERDEARDEAAMSSAARAAADEKVDAVMAYVLHLVEQTTAGHETAGHPADVAALLRRLLNGGEEPPPWPDEREAYSLAYTRHARRRSTPLRVSGG